MNDPMNLLIVGTGNVGNALAKRFARTAHVVNVGSRDAARGVEFGHRYDASGGGAGELVAQADVIFLAVPFSALEECVAQLGPVAGKVVVDCTNPLTPDYLELTVGHTTSAGEACRDLLPSARVVKAFNAIFADVVDADPAYAIPPQVFLASDDAAAKATVAELVEAIGYEPVDAGPLQNARLLEPLAELIIQLAYVMGNGTRITPVILRPTTATTSPAASGS